MTDWQPATHVIVPDDELRTIYRKLAALRDDKATLEIQLGVLRSENLLLRLALSSALTICRCDTEKERRVYNNILQSLGERPAVKAGLLFKPVLVKS